MNACMQCPYRNRVLGKPQRAMPQVRKITFKQIVQHWNNLFERNFADLRYVFAYFLRDKKHIFSSTVS